MSGHTGHAVDVPSGRPATSATPSPGDHRLARLSVNHKTVNRSTISELADGCARRGIPAVGLWREPVAEVGTTRVAKLVRDAGLRVSSLCRGGFLTAEEPVARRRALDDNRHAITEAAALGADCLVLVVGGLPPGSRDLDGARDRVQDAVAELAPAAAEHGVRLALEPLHPMYCADRAVLATLGQALGIAERVGGVHVGVVVDAYHVWWDPLLWESIAACRDRIWSFQVCDWVVPLADDVLLARGMMGDGCIDLRRMRRAVEHVGYGGDCEVEIFNADVWDADRAEVLDTVTRRYVEHVQ